jgi:glycosidase
VFVIGNHDIVRSYNRYGDGKHNDAIAKLMAGFYLTLRGTPIMYYGEEIGMENNDPKRKEDVKDPIGNGVAGRRKAATASARRCSGTRRPTRVQQDSSVASGAARAT